MGFFEWYGGLSPWLRFGVAIALLLVSTALWFARIFWPWGWVAGGILLVLSIPSGPQKKGYHDF